jgi:hypothetical protein
MHRGLSSTGTASAAIARDSESGSGMWFNYFGSDATVDQRENAWSGGCAVAGKEIRASMRVTLVCWER